MRTASEWFFQCGLLKYRSFELRSKLFEDEYKVPILAGCAARIAMINELTTRRCFSWPGYSAGHTATTRMMSVIQSSFTPARGPIMCFGIDPDFYSDTGTWTVLHRNLIERYLLSAGCIT